MMKIIIALAAAFAAVMALAVFVDAHIPHEVCTESHVEEAEASDVVAAYMFTGSKLVAAAAAQDRTVCDHWETVE